MASKVTQCPECKTSFKVGDEQLAIANGAVRCGACMAIFTASDHWLTNSPSFAASGDLTAIENAFEAEEPELDALLSMHADELDDIFADADDAPLFGDDFTDDSPADSTPSTQATPTDSENSPASATPPSNPVDEELLFTDTIQQPAINLIQKDDDESLLAELEKEFNEGVFKSFEQSDEVNLLEVEEEELLFDDNTGLDDDVFEDTRPVLVIDGAMMGDDDLTIDGDGPTTTQKLSASFLDIDNWEQDNAFLDQGDVELEEHSNEDWAEQLLAENTLEEQAASPDEGDALAGEKPTAVDEELLDILDSVPEDIAEDEFILGDEPMMAGERIGEHFNPLLANIQPEPVEMLGSGNSDRRHKLLWLAAAVICLGLLASQYLYFNFDRLAQDESSREHMASLCQLVGCKLPAKGNVELIRPSNLVVRSSTEHSNTLVVDVILTNRARFQQAFPTLELVFTDLNGAVLAGRRFTPGEYLQGELSGIGHMPSMQPIHVALEFIDPGETAVNYQLNLLPLTL